MVVVFKTSVANQQEAVQFKSMLNKLSDQWNFDLNDCDRILRVVIHETSRIEQIQKVFKEAGFHCDELPD